MAGNDAVKVEGLAGWVTVREASRLLGIGPTAVHMAIKRNRVPTIKVGNTTMVRLTDLQLTR
jgi:excisionase family DNA binding protein